MSAPKIIRSTLCIVTLCLAPLNANSQQTESKDETTSALADLYSTHFSLLQDVDKFGTDTYEAYCGIETDLVQNALEQKRNASAVPGEVVEFRSYRDCTVARENIIAYRATCKIEHQKGFFDSHIDGSEVPCLRYKGLSDITYVDYIPPYPLAEHNGKQFKSPDGDELQTVFIQAETVNNAQSFISFLQLSAADETKFDCDQGIICKVVISGKVNKRWNTHEGETGIGDKLEYYSICSVYVGDAIRSIPFQCRALVVIDIENKKLYVHAAISPTYALYHIGFPPPDIILKVPFDKGAEVEQKFLNLLSERLATETPFKFEEKRGLASGVILSSYGKVSGIIKGWREISTLRIDFIKGASLRYDEIFSQTLDDESDRNNLRFQLNFASTVYLNKQNTQEASDWSLPSDIQGRTYDRAVRNAIIAFIKDFCPGFKDLGNETFYCG